MGSQDRLASENDIEIVEGKFEKGDPSSQKSLAKEMKEDEKEKVNSLTVIFKQFISNLFLN